MRMLALILVIALSFVSSSAFAATLNVVGGQLFGASGVIVEGSSYDVEFLDGTCIALYNGCDDVSDFTFQTGLSALLASQALLDQVFLDGPLGSFDTVPDLTNGCEEPLLCRANTPYGFANLIETSIRLISANNRPIDASDALTGIVGWPVVQDSSSAGYDAFAVWSLVPEPNTALLLSLGLAGLSVRRR